MTTEWRGALGRLASDGAEAAVGGPATDEAESREPDDYYAELVGPGGDKATEVLVNPAAGAVWLEYGRAMMWNTRYGMMGESRGRGPAGDDERRPWIRRDDGRGVPWRPDLGSFARDHETERLDQGGQSGRSVGTADAFPGYYTLHTLQNDRVAGMLSVNAYTGAVWYHWWHGRFLSMTE